jgi:hypothetical protein
VGLSGGRPIFGALVFWLFPNFDLKFGLSFMVAVAFLLNVTDRNYLCPMTCL